MGKSETGQAAAPVPPAPAPAEFSEFFRARYKALIAVAVAEGATWEEAEDVVGQTMVDVFKRWSEIRSPLAYARQAVKTNLMKKQSRDREEVPRALKGGHGRPEAQPDPLMCEWEGEHWARQIIGALPPAQRDVAKLILIDGLTTAEAAGELHKSRDAVRKNLQLARERMRELVKDPQRLELEMERRVQNSTGPDRRKLDDQ